MTADETTGSVAVKAPQTGSEYLASLADDRTVFIYGERVKDVTRHPAFRNTARMVARLYDALHDPKRKGKLLLPTDTGNGGMTHAFFKAPKTPAEMLAGRAVVVSFTPHLVPMNRGILSTIYVRGLRGQTVENLHAILAKAYAREPFVHVLPFGQVPHTRHVRGSNMTLIGVAKDRVPGRAIVISALDNLVKGASGQAVQNMNLMLGYPETLGLEQVALFP